MRILLLVTLFFLTPLEAVAQFVCTSGDLATAASEELLKGLEQRYRTLEALEAEFSQNSLFLGFNERVESSGRIAFKKPGMMDWNYLRPDKQRFVADGRTLWFYQPDMNQVTVGTFQQSFQSGLPVSFLLGLGSLSSDFEVQRACRSAAGVVFALKPKTPDPSLDSFSLLVDEQTKLPKGARVVDIGGNETQIVFSELNPDVALESSRFDFQIPKGVDVIDQRDGAGL